MMIKGSNYLRLARENINEVRNFVCELDNNIADAFEEQCNCHAIEIPLVDFWNTIVALVNEKVDLKEIKCHFCIEDNEPFVNGGMIKFTDSENKNETT